MKDKIHVNAWNSSLNKKNEELCGDNVVSKINDESFIMVLGLENATIGLFLPISGRKKFN